MSTIPETLPIRINETCYRGDAWTRAYQPVEHDGLTPTATPTDMTGWTGRMQVRDKVDGTVYLEASSANGRITTGPQDNGQGTSWNLLVFFSATDTRSLPAGFVGLYDIELTRPDGTVATWYHGAFCVEGDVTT